MLEVRNLSVSYGLHRALDDVSLTVKQGEIVVILGANGAGKSTLLRAISDTGEGSRMGEVTLNGESITGLAAHEIVERGIALVPEGRGVFPDLNVHENLLLGAYTERARLEQQANMDKVLSLFPKLVERRGQAVCTMSGGEQQMVAVGRAMMSAPRILMLDEPSLGLSPLLCKEFFRSLTEVRKAGLGILLVEQNAKQSLAIADRGYLLENAVIVGEDSAENLINDPTVQKAYLGVSAGLPATAPPPSELPEAPLVAAQAAAASALSFISAGSAQSRTRTDDVVAGGIEELVRHAATLQSDHYKDASPERPKSEGQEKPYQGPDDRLSEMLAEIERAAVNARLPARPPESAKAAPALDSPAQNKPCREAPEEFDDLPAIEVWRREPEIEIYRRTDGKLKRVKGD